MKYTKKPLKGYVQIDMYPVYSELIYKGKEPFKIVGIRKDLVELEGDYSGGTHPVVQADWIDISDCFVVSTVCDEQLKPNGCQIHNVNCCGGGSILKDHVDKYWEKLVNI